MKTIISIVTLFLLVHGYSSAQQLNWITFEELPLKMRAEPKPILIFVHTDWCKYCAMQENGTFTNQEVINSLNENFYALRLNAEDNKEIIFLSKVYRFRSTGSNTGYHELAQLLAQKGGKVSFPTTVFLSEQFKILDVTAGLMGTEMLLEKIEAIIQEERD